MIIPNRYFYLTILAVVGGLIFLGKKIKMSRNVLFLAIGYTAGMCLLFASSSYRTMEFLCCVVLIFPLFVVYANDSDNRYDFMEAYTNIMLVISALSLFFFVFSSLLGIIKPTGYYPHTLIGWGRNNYYDYYHLYCEGQVISALGYRGIRNISIFVEGPMLAYTLSIALYYELFFRKKGFRKWAVITAILTIITSFSTTGYILVMLLLYFKFRDVIRRYKYFKLLMIPLLLVAVVYGVNYIITDKLANNIGSTTIRIDDIWTCLKCFAGNVIKGVGYQNIDGLGIYRTIQRSNAGLSTGLGGILAYGGLVWGIWYLIPLITAVKRFITVSESRCNMGFVLMVMFLLGVTVVHSRVLCTVINAMCWLLIIQKNNAYNIGGDHE